MKIWLNLQIFLSQRFKMMRTLNKMMNFNPIPKIKTFWDESMRMLSISYKPSSAEFRRTLKIVLLGTIILGALGYVISIIVGLIA